MRKKEGVGEKGKESEKVILRELKRGKYWKIKRLRKKDWEREKERKSYIDRRRDRERDSEGEKERESGKIILREGERKREK